MKTRSPHGLRAGSEAAFAAWWAAGRVVGHDLPTLDGRTVRVLYIGRAGGNAGPDFRDAVLLLDGVRLVGDVELHLRAANWLSHHHERDPRYEGVALHVVAGGTLPSGSQTVLASGRTIPTLMIGNLAQRLTEPATAPMWPCQTHPLTDAALHTALRDWGRARFAMRVARMRADLASGEAPETVLLRAMRNALTFGRQELHPRPIHDAAPPDPSSLIDRLTARRLRAFAEMLGAWNDMPVLAHICGTALAGGTIQGWERLMTLFSPAGRAIGARRAAIVLWNATLPLLAAYGDHCGNAALAATARNIAENAPDLPSNSITRAMTCWLRLAHAPRGALAQQGLHHLHTQWCRGKDCATCPAHKKDRMPEQPHRQK